MTVRSPAIAVTCSAAQLGRTAVIGQCACSTQFSPIEPMGAGDRASPAVPEHQEVGFAALPPAR